MVRDATVATRTGAPVCGCGLAACTASFPLHPSMRSTNNVKKKGKNAFKFFPFKGEGCNGCNKGVHGWTSVRARLERLARTSEASESCEVVPSMRPLNLGFSPCEPDTGGGGGGLLGFGRGSQKRGVVHLGG